MAAMQTTWINVNGLPVNPKPFSKLNPNAPAFVPTGNLNSVPSTSSPPEYQSTPIQACNINYHLGQPIQTEFPSSFNQLNEVSAHMPINQVDCNFIEAGSIIKEAIHSSDYSEHPSEEIFVNSQDSGTYSHEDQSQNYEKGFRRNIYPPRSFPRRCGERYSNSDYNRRPSEKFNRRRDDVRFGDNDFPRKEKFDDGTKWEKKTSTRGTYHSSDNSRGRGGGHYRGGGGNWHQQEHKTERSQKKFFRKDSYQQPDSRELLGGNFRHQRSPGNDEKTESSKILTGEVNWRRNSDTHQESQDFHDVDANSRNEDKVPIINHTENISQVPEEANIKENRSKSPRTRRRVSGSPQTQRRLRKKDSVRGVNSAGGADHVLRTRKTDTFNFNRNGIEKRKQGEESKGWKERDSETSRQDSKVSESRMLKWRKRDKSSPLTGQPRLASPPKENVNRDEEEKPIVMDQHLEKVEITERQQKPERVRREKQLKPGEKDGNKLDNSSLPTAPEKTLMSLNSIEVSRKFTKEDEEYSDNRRDINLRRATNKYQLARDHDKKRETKDVIVHAKRTSDNKSEESSNRGKIVAEGTVKSCQRKPEAKPEEEDFKKNNVWETRKFVDPRMEREKQHLSNPGQLSAYCDRNRDVDVVGKEFDQWGKDWENIKEFKVVNEIVGDLFDQPKDFSLAHCVAEDLRMGSGIAVAFKRDFKSLPELLDQKAKQGGLAILHDDKANRYVYYLITKRESTAKPTYLSLWKSLWKMRQHFRENDVKKVAVPRLGCGLDRLEWDKVKSMLECLFKDMDIEIRVCSLQQSEQVEERKSKCKLVIEEYPITKIDSYTLLIYLALAKGNPDEIMLEMAKQTHFLPAFQKYEPKLLGEIVYHEDKLLNLGVCGCIVRDTSQDPLSFLSLGKCIDKINKLNKGFKDKKFEYVAFQWVDEKDYFDDCINEKIITMFINLLRNVDVYVCRGKFKEDDSQ
ncbi:biorientation of chromosomes in cell division protein 1-like 1 isoform X2 [Euwallacea fornicatus]|uniref:biorientation of chromosomes in cell division protein 1-like 1 isoform X2 n=1 Tax=Euwallacea fornicatus TaxID=995702 RepID=UPI00338DB641